jgi:hypothetical protein
MTRFFRRLASFTIALVTFAVALFLILQLEPASLGGWVLLAVLFLVAVAGSLYVYRALMGSHFAPGMVSPDGQDRYAPGLAVGTSAGQSRRRRDDGDEDMDAAAGSRGGDAGDDPTGSGAGL